MGIQIISVKYTKNTRIAMLLKLTRSLIIKSTKPAQYNPIKTRKKLSDLAYPQDHLIFFKFFFILCYEDRSF